MQVLYIVGVLQCMTRNRHHYQQWRPITTYEIQSVFIFCNNHSRRHRACNIAFIRQFSTDFALGYTRIQLQVKYAWWHDRPMSSLINNCTQFDVITADFRPQRVFFVLQVWQTIWWITRLCSASSTRLSTWHCPHLLTNAVLRRRCCWAPAPAAVPPTRRSAANPPQAAAAVERWDRRTDARPLYRPCSIYAQYAGSAVNNALPRRGDLAV